MCPPTSSSTHPQDSSGTSTQIPDCVPTDQLSQTAYNYAKQNLAPTILNHSLRVYLYARAISSREARENRESNSESWISPSRLPLHFAACILHDIGTTDPHNGPQRFEVEGADAAAALLRQNHVPEDDVDEVWTAIALHTSPGIAERITSLARLVRLGVTIDFKRAASMSFTSSDEVEDIEAKFPRMEIEKVLGDAVVEQALHQPEKAPAASWPGILLRAAKENPGWEGVNKAF